MLAAAALAVAGCAAHPPRDAAKNIAGNTAPPPAAEPKLAMPAPAPATGLWERIRRGLALPQAGAHPQIRAWTQFYASHREHLLGSAQRARPFLWHIVEAVDARGMPMELALLPIVESGFNPRAYSRSGAAGLWQFIPGTAERFGLQSNWWYQGRLDVLAATSAALDYLAWLHARFGNWLLALAAYNCGENCVGAELERVRVAGEPMDFWHLDLPAQTEDYVPKLLALKRLLVGADAYALNWPQIPNRALTAAVALPAQVELSVAAGLIDMPVAQLRDLNPAFQRFATHPDVDRGLLVPIAYADKLRTALAAADPKNLVTSHRHRVVRGEVLGRIAEHYGTTVARIVAANNLSANLIHPGDELVIPTGSRVPAPATEVAAAAEPPAVQHRVERGQTLWGIARRYRVGVDELRRWNDLAASAVLLPGQVLALRGVGGEVMARHVVAAGESLWGIARRYGVAVTMLRRWNAIGPDAVLQPGQTLKLGPQQTGQVVYYRVRDGDTLWSIAHRYGVEVADLRAWNQLAEVTIHPGQRLRVVVADAV